MEKKLCTIPTLLGLFVGSSALAAGIGEQSGSAFTHASSINHHSIYSSISNPAMAPLTIPEGENWRTSYFAGGSFDVEIGDVNNFVDDVDDLIDILDDPNSTDDEPSEILDRFNTLLPKIGEHAYLKSNASIHVPIFPFFYQPDDLSGTFGFDLVTGVTLAGSILDAPLSLDSDNNKFKTSTSLYLKSGLETRASISYADQFFEDTTLSDHGKFYAGAKLNFYYVQLSKQIKLLMDFDGEGIEDVISDDYDKNLVSTTGFGVDLGVVWDAERYRLGANFKNLNSPKFSYGSVGVDCYDIEGDQLARNSCEISAYFVRQGRIKQKEEHTMHARMDVDALFKLTDRWFVSGSVDTSKYEDFVGFEHQWMNVSTSYETKGWWPSSRVGYQKNLAGSELSSVLVGFTFFKSVTLDIEYGLETVDVDGTSSPRRVGFALGFEEKF